MKTLGFNLSIRSMSVLLAMLLLSACASKQTADSDVMDGQLQTGTSTGLGQDETVSSSAADAAYNAQQAASAAEREAALRTNVFYFGFDQSSLSSSAKLALKFHAQALSASGDSVVLEGHADERGSREYNLALGERRAKAIGSYLMSQGVRRGQIRHVSYGEEKPENPAHNEAAWSQNRRVVLR